MASKQAIIDKITSFENRIREHYDKITIERHKPRPNENRINHWYKEVDGFSAQMERLRDQLNDGGYSVYCYTCGKDMHMRNNKCVRCKSYLA